MLRLELLHGLRWVQTRTYIVLSGARKAGGGPRGALAGSKIHRTHSILELSAFEAAVRNGPQVQESQQELSRERAV